MEKKTTGKPDAAKTAVETAAAAVAETKEAAKKVEKKAAEKVETVKAAAKKAVEKAEVKKADTKKKEEIRPEVFVQFRDQEAVVAEVTEKAKKEYEAEGHRISAIKSFQI